MCKYLRGMSSDIGVFNCAGKLFLSFIYLVSCETVYNPSELFGSLTFGTNVIASFPLDPPWTTMFS